MKSNLLAASTLGGVALLMAVVTPSRADVIYTDQAAFNAAVSSATVVTFNGLAPAGSFTSYGNGPLTQSGVTFTGNGSMYVLDPGYYGSSYADGDYLNSDYSSPDIITVTFPASRAVGFNFGGLFGPATFSVTLSDGFTDSQATSNSITGTAALSFMGYTTSTPITSIVITMPDGPSYNAIDNFTIERLAVPEPATLGVIGIGLIALAGTRRKVYPRIS